MKKLLALLFVAALLGSNTGCPPATSAPTEKKKEPTTGTAEEKEHKGKFVSFKDDTLTITDKEDKKHEFKVKDVKEIKEMKLDEVKPGTTVTVWTKDEKPTKVKVEKEAAVTPKMETTKGKFVSYKDGELVIKDAKDKEVKFMVKDVKDIKELKLEDVKPGADVEVTTADEKPSKVEVKKEVVAPKVETVEGKFVSLKDDKLTIKVDDKDKDFDVKGVKDVPKADDLKDAKVAVTTTDGKVTKVEKK